MKINKLTVGQLQTNCYLLFDEKNNKALIIDPGDDADYIISKLSALRLLPIAILATHGHFDHILAVTELKLAYNIPFYLHQADEFLLARMQQSALHFTAQKTDPPPKVDVYLKERVKLDAGNWKLETIYTPGHTPGSICFYSSADNILIAGDTIFANGLVGRTDFSYGNQKDLKKSIQKILKLPPNTTIYPGHGESSIIKEERKYHKEI